MEKQSQAVKGRWGIARKNLRKISTLFLLYITPCNTLSPIIYRPWNPSFFSVRLANLPCSRLSKYRFTSIPAPKPPRPSIETTLWHGIRIRKWIALQCLPYGRRTPRSTYHAGNIFVISCLVIWYCAHGRPDLIGKGASIYIPP
jgi:hypothetical protein